MFRHKMRNRAKDSRIFRHTAEKTNSVNVYDSIPRGGTRM